jgi:hypothetical protein
MANIRKQFNFRNGVQVDDDSLVVSPTGLVGIGTTIPTESLDVRGIAKVVGLVTATEIYTPYLTAENVNITTLILGDSIVGGGVSIRSGIITSSGTGVVTYYGDGGRLINLPTSQWLDIDVGLGFTSIYAQGFVGVSTNDPRYPFQVGGTNNIGAFTDGVGINSNGNIVATGIVTGGKFAGIGSDIIDLNASNIAYGTISNDRIPVLLNSKIPSDIQISGIMTATTFSGNLSGNVTGNIVGNVTGIASTARSLTGNPDILVNNITATSIAVTSITNATSISALNINLTGIATAPKLNIGVGGTAVTLTSEGRIGIGSVIPNKDIQLLKTGTSSVEFTGTNQSELILGQQQTPSFGIGNSTGIIRFGNQSRTFDIINADSGDLNTILHLASPISGITTGSFNWIYGQTLNKLMTLTYEGNLGVGKTNPENKLEVAGVGTFTSDLYVGGNVYVSGNINGTLTGNIIATQVISNSGISTVYDLRVQNIASLASVGIGTTQPLTNFDARTTTALFSQVGLGSTAPRVTLDVNGQALISSVGIGTTTTGGNGLVISDDAVILSNNLIEGNSVSIILNNQSDIGIGTTSSRCAIDFSDAGTNLSSGAYRYMLPPRITTTQRNALSPVSGAFIFNTTTSKFQGYTGIAWTDFH